MEETDKFVVEKPILTNGNSFEGQHFAIPVQMGEWWFIVTSPHPSTDKFQNKLMRFIYSIEHQCRENGLGSQRIKQFCCDRTYNSELESLFVKAKAEGVQYMIVGSDQPMKIGKDFHYFIKSLEQKYSIATCHIIYDNISGDNIPLGSNDLVSNVVKKANMKLGGLNYFIKEGQEKFYAADNLIIGVNINYYNIPMHYLNQANSQTGERITIVGFAANDLVEPNVFTGDFLYTARDPKRLLEVLKDVLTGCVRRYQSNREKLPQSITMIISVRDCHKQFKIFYRELGELCTLVQDEFSFTGPLQMITFNKLEQSFGDDDQKPIPGTLLNNYITRDDAIAFNMITHWAPVIKGKGKYEARAGHFEVYTSYRCDPTFKKPPKKFEQEKRSSWSGVVQPNWGQTEGFNVPSKNTDDGKPKPNWASKNNEIASVSVEANKPVVKPGWGSDLKNQDKPKPQWNFSSNVGASKPAVNGWNAKPNVEASKPVVKPGWGSDLKDQDKPKPQWNFSSNVGASKPVVNGWNAKPNVEASKSVVKPGWGSDLKDQSKPKPQWNFSQNADSSKPAVNGGWGVGTMNWNTEVKPSFSKPRFEEKDYVFPGDDPKFAGIFTEQSDILYWPRMMYALGHYHQLVNYPTSLPGPIRIANTLSHRGQDLLHHNLKIETLKGTVAEVLERFNKWTYKDTTLRDQRFSA